MLTFIKERRDICQACEYRDEGTCTRCGCPIFMKTAIPVDTCPEGKWKDNAAEEYPEQ